MKPLLAVIRNVDISSTQIQGKSPLIVSKPIESPSTGSPYAKILCSLFLLSFLPCYGSTVFIWLDRDGIVAGSDSLETQEFGTAMKEGMTCKIKPAGEFYVAATGMTRANNPANLAEILFSPFEIARSLAANSTDVRDLMGKFIEATQPQFQIMMMQWLRQNPTRFMKDVNGRDGALAVAIFEISHEGPVIGIVSFSATVGPVGVQVNHSAPKFCPDECDMARGAIARLGAQDTLPIGPMPTNNNDAIPWVAGVVRAEIDADEMRAERENKSRAVGGPISMLSLTRSVTRWPEGYHETCPEQPR
jgi:hypothetical protein